MDLKDFHTREESEAGLEVPLYDSKTGEKSEHTLRVRNCDSNEYQLARIGYQRTRAIVSAESDDAKACLLELAYQRKLSASLVMGWSFEEKCTPEAVVDLFKNAPGIQEMVERIAADRQLFFTLKNLELLDTSESKPS